MNYIDKFMAMFSEDTVIDSVSIDVLVDQMKEMSSLNIDNITLLEETFKNDEKKDGLLTNKFEKSDLFKYFTNAGFNDKSVYKNLSNLKWLNRELLSATITLRKMLEEEVITTGGMSDRDKAIVKSITDIKDCLNYIKTFLLTLSFLDDDEMYYSIKQKEAMEYLRKENNVLRYFKRIDIKDIPRTIEKASLEYHKEVSSKLHRSVIGGIITKFTGNPIYHIGMWWEGILQERYEADVDQANLTRLKIMELRAKTVDGDSSSIKRQIEYYEEKLTKLENNIKEYQEG